LENSVTVHCGALYLSSNFGFVARYDARDGTLEWARTYERSSVRHTRGRMTASYAYRYDGSPPLIVGGTIVCAPRDGAVVLCLNAEDGGLLWRHPGLSSERIVGACGSRILLSGRQSIVGLDGVSGKALWERTFGDTQFFFPVVCGAVVYLGIESELIALEARTGDTIERKPWPETGPLETFAVNSDAIVGTTWERPAGGR
jgi:outer membrane protein assembly factor BamB